MNIINKNELIKNKVWLVILSPILTFFMFFIMGNWSMVTIDTSNIQGITKASVLADCFSMSILDILFLYLIIAVLVGIFFRDKEEIFEGIVNKELDKKTVLFTKIILCILPLFISIVINLVVKLITCMVIKNSVLNVVGVTISAFFLFVVYVVVLAILMLSILLLLNIAVTQTWVATLIPLFIYNGIILIFGIAPFFISDKFQAISKTLKPMAENILDSLQLILINSSLPVESIGKQYIVLAILFIISLLVIYISYIMLDLLNQRNITKIYVFSPIRHVFYFTLAALIGFYTVSGVGYLYLISESTYEYNEGIFYINLISFAVVIVLYAVFNLIYKYRFENKSVKVESEISDIDSKVFEKIEESERILSINENEFILEEESDEDVMKKLLINNEVDCEYEDKDEDEEIHESYSSSINEIQYESEIQVEFDDNLDVSEECIKEILLDESIKEEKEVYAIVEELNEDDNNIAEAEEETLAERIYADYMASLSTENK